MNRIIKIIAALAAAVALAACGSLGGGQPATPYGVMSGIYVSLGTLDEQVGNAAFAGRLSATKAQSILDETGRIRLQLSQARELLRGCQGKTPCEAFDASLRGINERLIEVQCRRRQAEAGLPEDVCKLPPRTQS